jgi:peroxiredoxin
MKTRIKTIAILSILAGTLYPCAALQIGDPLVDTTIKMKNVDNAMVSIGDIQGEKGTLVIFTCNHCPFVKAWQDRMVEIGNTCTSKGIGVIFINSNDPAIKGDTFEGMQKLAKAKGYTFPYVVDATSEVAKHFGAKKTPDVFLFNANGNLIYRGAVDDNSRKPDQVTKPYLKDALEAVINGKEVSTKETKSVGCSIKFR